MAVPVYFTVAVTIIFLLYFPIMRMFGKMFKQDNTIISIEHYDMVYWIDLIDWFMFIEFILLIELFNMIGNNPELRMISWNLILLCYDLLHN